MKNRVAFTRHSERSASKVQHEREAADCLVRISGLTKRFGSVTAVRDLDLAITQGELVALLGPSGCGKTTSLRMVAGFEVPSSGSIEVDGRVISKSNWAVPPDARGIGMVFQSYALWPHMTVYANVAFPLKLRKWGKSDIESRVKEVLSQVGMGEFPSRFPSQLSGGQQQRVALARALAGHPSILLLDEPLSNLDASLRESMRFEIRDIQQRLGMTSLYVTHSQEEALALADRIAVMRDGALVQVGTPDEMFFWPTNEFVAKVIGVANVLPGHIMSVEGRYLKVELDAGAVWYGRTRAPDLSVGDHVDVMVRPSTMTIASSGNPSVDSGATGEELRSDWNALDGVVAKAAYAGNLVDYFVASTRGGNDEVRVQRGPPRVADAGDLVMIGCRPDDVVVMKKDGAPDRSVK